MSNFTQESDFKNIWKQIRFPILLIIYCFVGGSLGYKLLFPEAAWDHIYLMTAITLSTVGYGDYLGIDKNSWAIYYSIFLIFVGMLSVMYAISIMTAFLVEGKLISLFKKNRMKTKVAQMENHFIVCGAGPTGIHVIREMITTLTPVVVIEIDPKHNQELRQEFPEILLIEGDALKDAVLLEAGIRKAKGIVASLASDKDNLVLTLSARTLNENIKIVTQVTDLHLQNKFHHAGANYTVCQSFYGGMRMASARVVQEISCLV